MKTWLITGASRGLGLAIAREAVARGDRAVLTARNPDALSDLAKAYPDRVMPIRMDMDDDASIADGVAKAEAWAADGIDILANNAGRGLHGAIEEVSDAEAQALFRTNVFGTLAVTRPVLRGMRQRRRGHVINIGSVAGLVANAGTGIYAATKFALEGISEALRSEVAPFGIKVTIVEPGSFRTDFFSPSSISRAETIIPDYEEIVGKRIEMLNATSGRQPGDPRKAATLICDLAMTADAPLHVVMGKVAFERLDAKLKNFTAELDAWRERGSSTSF